VAEKPEKNKKSNQPIPKNQKERKTFRRRPPQKKTENNGPAERKTKKTAFAVLSNPTNDFQSETKTM